MYTIQRFRGGWAVVWRDAEGVRRRFSLSATTRIEAEIEARQRWRIGSAGGVWSLGRIVEAYMADRKADGIKTPQRQADAWKSMKPFWGNLLPAHVDTGACREYHRQRTETGRKVSPSTVHYELSMLRQALLWAENKAKVIEKAPEVWLPRKRERGEQHITKEQFLRFLDACQMPHVKLYAILGVCTGARPEAILTLKWEQVNLRTRLINLNPPGRELTNKRRPTVPINDRAYAALVEAQQAAITPYVIEWAGAPVKSIKTAFRLASKRCGIKVTPYTLRHSAAVWAAEAGAPMSEISQYLGHTNTKTTEKHYAKYSPTYLRKVAGVLDW